MSKDMSRLMFYSTVEVMTQEEKLYFRKYGDTEETRKKVEELAKNFVNEQMTNLKEDVSSINGVLDRFGVTIEEEESGDYWICLKMFKLNDLWKILGTEDMEST